MQPRHSTTPFGRRSLALAHVATQTLANARPADKVVHKWLLFRAICAAKLRLGVSDRALSVLNALLTFHPDATLTGELVVFPSNAQLSLRSHGMAAATLRRHLAVLVDAGLIVRRDSPNGKRYARRDDVGEIETAYGFDLGPLVARSEEIEALAAAVDAELRAVKFARERITICRRDVVKMIATGIEEGVPSRSGGNGFASWMDAQDQYRAILDRLPRTASRSVLEEIADALDRLAEKVLTVLQFHANQTNPRANESQTERHIQNSKPKSPIDIEPAFQESQGARAEPVLKAIAGGAGSYPLGMILDACPDVVDYARHGVSNWRDFLAAASVVRTALGISPSAWDEARQALGEADAAIVVAAMLQRSDAISSPGGYLRELTRKAVVGEFSVGPMLMALISSRKRPKSA